MRWTWLVAVALLTGCVDLAPFHVQTLPDCFAVRTSERDRFGAPAAAERFCAERGLAASERGRTWVDDLPWRTELVFTCTAQPAVSHTGRLERRPTER